MLRARYRKILLFYARVIFSLAFWDVLLPAFGLKRISKKGRQGRLKGAAERYRQLAVEMGGVMIKIGQFLSTRVDILPPEVTDELSGLQDMVPAEDFSSIRQLAENEYGKPLTEIFESFEEKPLASASLGQVHRAVLKSPAENYADDNLHIRQVVVKVQRSNIEQIIETDLAALKRVAGWLDRYPPIRKRADLSALIDEFSRILAEEINYLAEGQNAQRFLEYYHGRKGIRIPQTIWSHTTRRVLTLEDVYAIKITDYQGITQAGIKRPEVAKRLFDCYMEQIFEQQFFHADPHPGNLFVIPAASEESNQTAEIEPSSWDLAFVDFGMVGYIPETVLDGLREAVIAIGTQDPARLVKSYQKLGFLLPEADLGVLEQAEAEAFQRFWGKSMGELMEIDYQELLDFASEFRELMYAMPFQIPQDLILLGRALAILSGMCTGLDPAFNVWDQVRPYAERLIKAEVTSNWEYWLNELEILLRALLAAPRKMESVLNRLDQGDFSVQVPELQDHLVGIDTNLQRLTGAIVFAALLLGGVQLLLSGLSLPGLILFGAALIALVVLILK